jgi:hypothetical protein
VGGDEELDRPRRAGGAADEAAPFELLQPSDERREGSGVDKGEILALKGRVPGRGRVSDGFARHFGQLQRGARARARQTSCSACRRRVSACTRDHSPRGMRTRRDRGPGPTPRQSGHPFISMNRAIPERTSGRPY